jgi:hypothetical protein
VIYGVMGVVFAFVAIRFIVGLMWCCLRSSRSVRATFPRAAPPAWIHWSRFAMSSDPGDLPESRRASAGKAAGWPAAAWISPHGRTSPSNDGPEIAASPLRLAAALGEP